METLLRDRTVVAARAGGPRLRLPAMVHWALRIGVAGEFIGHGMAGLYHSKAWIPYFTFFGFSPDFAQHHLMYVTGTVDILLGILVLVRPMRAVLLHMAFWGFMTAWLRPLTGESWFELVERGANYGMPAAFLLLSGWGTWSLRTWFERIRPPLTFSDDLARQVSWVIRISIALLLVGHGGLGIWAGKPEWMKFFGYFGISAATATSAHLSQWVGIFEVALGVAVLVKPVRSLLLFVLVWKLGSELLRPLVGQNNYQFVERAGDYALPIALIWLDAWRRARARVPRTSWADEPLVAVAVAAAVAAPAAAPAAAPVSATVAGAAPPAVPVNGNGHVPGYVSLTTSLLAARAPSRPVEAPANGHGPRVPHAPKAELDPALVAAAAALNARLAAARRGTEVRIGG